MKTMQSAFLNSGACNNTLSPSRGLRICVSTRRWARSPSYFRIGLQRSRRTVPLSEKFMIKVSISEEEQSQPLSEEEREFNLAQELDIKPLRWSEIPFSSIHEELKAIDDYEREQDLRKDDAWPKFLRGAAYEYWGQPQLALAQYGQTQLAGGLRQVPELWERRAYNSFKIGKVGEAYAYFQVAAGLLEESVGNELHFVHWFASNFKDYVPKRNGPVAPIQAGICKYHVGLYKQARESLMPQIFLKDKDMEHAVLWYLAASARMRPDRSISSTDVRVLTKSLDSEFDWSPRMRLFAELYRAAGETHFGKVSEIENELSEAIKSEESDDITTNVYIALYHDAFTQDEAERDRALDTVAAIGSTALPNDTENFLFCSAKNRLTAPPGAEKTKVTEQIR